MDTTKPIRQHQDFDKVLKKTFARVYESLIHKLIGLDLSKTVKLPTTFSRTKEKRPDFAVKVNPDNDSTHIVHVEFQGRNDEHMHKRQLGYYNDFYWEFDLPIKQYVIFMGSGKPHMTTSINHPALQFSYKMIVLNELDVEIFLNSDTPHEIILAILCRYDKKKAPEIIRQILEKLQKIARNERQLFEFTTDLEILSGLRKLQSETKKQVDKMPITYDITKDPRFIEGEQFGIQKGIKKGIEKGIEKGKLEGELSKARIAVINLLKNKILDIFQIAQVLEVPIDFVKAIQDEIKKNPKLKA